MLDKPAMNRHWPKLKQQTFAPERKMMNETSKDYTPINCGFHDRLEAWVVTKADCDVEYLDVNGDLQKISGKLTDVFSRGSEEFTQLQSGEEIRLDRIQSINGIPLPRSC